MNAKKCDRCGGFYVVPRNNEYLIRNVPGRAPGDFIAIGQYGNDTNWPSNRIELCPFCADQLSLFLRDKDAAVVSVMETAPIKED